MQLTRHQEDSVAEVQNSAFTENSDGIRGLEMDPEGGRYTKECMRSGRISSSISIKLWQDRRVCYL